MDTPAATVRLQFPTITAFWIVCVAMVFCATSIHTATADVVPAPATPRNVVLLRDLSGVTHRGTLRELSPQKVRLEGARPEEFSLSDVVRIDWEDRTPHRGDETALLFANGDRMLAAPNTISDDALTGRWSAFPNWPDVRVPLETLEGLLLNPARHRRTRQKLENLILNQTEDNDVLFLSNGDRLSGQLLSLEEGVFRLDSAVGEVPLERAGIRGVGFNPQLTSFPKVDGPTCLVMLMDGSWLTAQKVALDANGMMTVEAAYGSLLEFPTEAIDSLQFFSSHVLKLSDLEPAVYRHVPFVGVSWDLVRNRNVLGGPLAVGNQEYAHGVGLHSQSEVSYRLNGAYRRFEALVGIDDQTEGLGSVRVRVMADGKEVFASGLIQGGTPPVPVSLGQLQRVELLTLTVEFANRGDIQDNCDWCDAILIR